MLIFLELAAMLAGLALLIKGADIMVDGASNIARKYRVSELVIAMTIIAFGTSLPEFVISFTAAFNGNSDISIGNIIGSNLFNLLVVLGITGLIYPISVQKNTIRFEIPYALLAAVALLVFANTTIMFKFKNHIDRIDGLIFLMLFAFFLVYVYVNMKKEQATNKATDDSSETEQAFSLTRSIVFMVVGLVLLIVGGELVVTFASKFAKAVGVTDKVIALTIIACGTSLPELTISVMAILKKKSDIAIGNIVGSNIFNILFILGASALVFPLKYEPIFNIDLYFLLGAQILLYVYTKMNKKLDRLEGFIFLGFYAWYMVYILMRG